MQTETRGERKVCKSFNSLQGRFTGNPHGGSIGGVRKTGEKTKKWSETHQIPRTARVRGRRGRVGNRGEGETLGFMMGAGGRGETGAKH